MSINIDVYMYMSVSIYVCTQLFMHLFQSLFIAIITTVYVN